jgi:hypothetical protein
VLHGGPVRKASSARKGKGPAFNRTSKVFPNPHLLKRHRTSVSTAYFQMIAGSPAVDLLEQPCAGLAVCPKPER